MTFQLHNFIFPVLVRHDFHLGNSGAFEKLFVLVGPSTKGQKRALKHVVKNNEYTGGKKSHTLGLFLFLPQRSSLHQNF